MEYFKNFVSNTSAGSGNQMLVKSENENEIKTGRLFYKVNNGGEYEYSFLFSNIADSTFSDGKLSHCNLICGGWTIHSLSAGVCSTCCADHMTDDIRFFPVTFSGKEQKEVMPGEFFASDPLKLCANSADYICIQISFSAKEFFCHEESLIPTFILKDGAWEPCKHMPFLSMLGCKRDAKLKIAFLGDSITQGIGTDINSYEHWNYKVAKKLGFLYAYWNLGLGFGRAQDAASDSAWLFKAKQNDVVVVCYGVNDILQGRSENQIKNDLLNITDKLTAAGVKVFIQTVPPFDYTGEKIDIWKNVNEYIKTVIAPKCIGIFDTSDVLSQSKELLHIAKYGGHPNSTGCTAWADALYPVLKNAIEK